MSEVEPDSVSLVGNRLKSAREAKKMSLEEIAGQTRIPIRHLKHIENEEWSALPAATYSVGFARAYANAVGLNGNEIGQELRRQIGAVRPNYEPQQSYYEPADPARVPPKSLALVTGILALLLVIGYIIWRAVTISNIDTDQAASPRPEASQTDAGQSTPASTARASGNPGAAQNATGPVVLTALADVWVRIYEGDNGALIHEAVMRAGERFDVPADARAPQIRTGRPEALQITVGTVEIPPLGQPQQTVDHISLLPKDLIIRAQNRAQAPDSLSLPPPLAAQVQ